MASEEEREVFEFEESEQVLNLDFYIHRSIMRWQDALEKAIIQGKIEDGLVARGLAAEMVVGCATAKQLIHWEKQEIPEEDGKKKDKILKDNQEAEEFKKKFDEFKKEINKQEFSDKKIKDVRISDFKVYEVLKKINIGASKKGKVII